MTTKSAQCRNLVWRVLTAILRPKFSLRTLLIVMFVAAVVVAWWSQGGRVQQEVCRELTKRNIDWGLVETVPWHWQWLPKRILDLGEGHWFRHLNHVSYSPMGPTQQADDAALIARLPKVDRLLLSWHGSLAEVEKARIQLLPLSQARGIDGIDLNPFSLAMSEPSPSLSTPLFEAIPPMPCLKRLNVELATLSVDQLRSLDRFLNLIDLDLSHTSVDTNGVVHIARLTRLERLDLSGQHIGDAQLHHLRSLRRIKELHLDGNAITNNGLDEIASLATLTELHLGDNPITHITALRPLHQLKTLDLSDTPLADAGLAVVDAWPQLEKIDLSRSTVTSQVVPNLLAAKNLKHLDLDECDLDDAAVTALLKGLKLETLNIKKTFVSSAILAEINRCRTLKQIEIEHLRFSLADLLQSDPKAKFQGVPDEFRHGLGHFDPAFAGAGGNSLRLFAVTEVADHLEAIRRNKTITTLSLALTDISDADLEVVGTLTQLTDLDLRSTSITDAGLAHMSGLVNLERLDLSETQVTRDALQHLAAMQKLSHLRLVNVDLTQGEADRWPILPAVTQLEISRSTLSAEKPLPLSAFPNLTFLECRDTTIPATALAELSQLPHLDYLLLGNIDDPDAFVKTLEGNAKLTKLYFAADELSPESFAVLRRLPALDTLCLSLKSLSVEQLGPLAGHPTLRIFWCDPAPWNTAFLPIAASLPKLVVFRSEGVVLPDATLSLLRKEPIGASHTIEWRNEFGALPTGENVFQIAATSQQISLINLQGVVVDDAVLRDISLIPSLTWLKLNRCTLPGNAGQYIAAISGLTELELQDVQVTPELLAQLKALRNLTKLDLSGATMSSQAVSHLMNLTTLEKLNLERTNISDADAARLFALPNLKDLNLRKTSISSAALTNAVQARQLRSLDVSDTGAANDAILVLKHHPSLQWFKQGDEWLRAKECDYYLRGQSRSDWMALNLTHEKLAIEPDGGLPHLKFLRYLTVTKTGKVGQILDLAARHCPTVESLHFANEDISADHMKRLPISVQHVYFKNCQFAPDAFDELPAVHVHHFRFIDCPPCDVNLKGLSRLPSLRLVMIEGTSTITSEQAIQLSHCRQLRDVRLGTSQASEEAIRKLADLPSIRSLGVRPGSLSSETRAQIKQRKPWLEIQ